MGDKRQLLLKKYATLVTIIDVLANSPVFLDFLFARLFQRGNFLL